MLCLILITGGAITTVAVAWGIALLVDAEAKAGTWLSAENVLARNDKGWVTDYWSVDRLEWRTWTVLSSVRRINASLGGLGNDFSDPSALLPPWSNLSRPRREYFYADSVSDREDRYNLAYGWPMLSLWYEAIDFDDELVKVGCFQLGAPDDLSRCLPFQPIWPGFVIDTLFYAATWFGVFFGFASAKRAIRRKRGRCPRCGYDLRGGVRVEPPATSPGCPECGWGRERQ